MTHLTLREARKRRRMTQDVLALRAGIDQTYISSLETGRRRPSDDAKARLAKALGIAPSRLRFAEPQPHESVKLSRDRVGHSNRSVLAADSKGAA